MSDVTTMCEQAEAWALGALDPAEARAFGGHLAGCAACAEAVRQYRELSLLLAEAAPPAAPPAGLRDRVISSVRPSRRGVRGAPLALAAGLAALALVGAGVQSARLSLAGRRVAQLGDSLASREARVAELLRQRDAILDDHTVMYVVRPTQDSAAPFGAQVFWRRDRQTWLVHAYALPALPAGRVYQLWFVTPDARISAGVFGVDAEGHGIAIIDVPPAARGATMAAFSVEPTGGSPQPTGPIVLAGAVAAGS